MNPEPDHPRFEDLLRRLLDGETDDSGKNNASLAEIEDAMRRDPALRRDYLDQVELDALLDWELGGLVGHDLDFEEPAADAVPPADKVAPFPRRSPAALAKSPWRSAAAAIAAAALLGAGYYLGTNSGDSAFPASPATAESPAPAVAVLIESEDSVWELEDGREPGFGSSFSEGETLRLEAGVARLAMRNSAGFSLEGPAEVDLVNREVLRVRRGQVSAFAPDEAVGFTVLTPELEIVDLGTRFATAVGDDGSTEVHVFEGEVSVQGRAGGEAAAELIHTGQARRYDLGNKGRSEISVDPERFAAPPDLDQLLAVTRDVPASPPALDRDGAPVPFRAAENLLAFQDFSRGSGDLGSTFGGHGFHHSEPWSAKRGFTRLVPSVLSHSGQARAGGYLLVRGRDRVEPNLANRFSRQFAEPLPSEFVVALRGSYHGLDGDDFIGLWLDTRDHENLSHVDAPTIGFHDGEFYARLDLDHRVFGRRIEDGEPFLLAARHRWDAETRRSTMEVWIDPVPGSAPNGSVEGPIRKKRPALHHLGLRIGQYTEVSDRLYLRGLAVGRSLEPVLDALAQ